jgi:HSP20 family molecular chaperone IbpA
MKHIRKFNESIDVVDPMMDALDFREKFSSQITKNSRLDHELREIENNSTNQTEDYNIYEVYETDEDVRRR